MIKKEKIIIVGGSGSGKDFLLRGLIKKGLTYTPKYTTRPKRYNELDGKEYNFVIEEDFNRMMVLNNIKTSQSFIINGVEWIYFITKENFDKGQIFVMTPHEISQLSEECLSGCFVVYLDIPQDIRRKRISNRNDNNDSIDRRIKSDTIDFENFDKYDLRITDSEFDVDLIYDLMA